MESVEYAAARKAALETLNNSLCPRLDVLVHTNGSAAKLARKLPRVHVYNWLDDFHEALLRVPSSRGYQDVWSGQNQFYSEVAFHRALLRSLGASDGVVRWHPHEADLFVVPFYSILAWHNKTIQRGMWDVLEARLQSSPAWRRSGGCDHLFLISSTRASGDLFSPTLERLLRSATLLRIDTRDERKHKASNLLATAPRQIAVPYYVARLATDEHSRRRDERPHSVCFEGSDTHPTRRALFELFRDYPGADVRAPAKLGRHGHVKRNPVCATRERMASCRFCLVPPGLTPTSRRLYEAIATRCVPVIVSDRFVVPFSELIGDAALDQLVLRIPEAEVATAPRRLREADEPESYARRLAALEAHREWFLYDDFLHAPGFPLTEGGWMPDGGWVPDGVWRPSVAQSWGMPPPKGKGRRREGAVPCSGALCAMLVQASRVISNNCSK